MAFASVVLDIPTRALEGAYDYAVPSELEGEVAVGATVLVDFARRPSVGYVVRVADAPSEGVDPTRIRPVRSVLAAPAFDGPSAELALWMAREYACPPSACVRLFLPPGLDHRLRKGDEGAWELSSRDLGAPDRRWVRLTDAAESFEPAANATRQRRLIEALGRGPVRYSELRAMLADVSQPLTSLAAKGVVEVFEASMDVIEPEGTTLASAAAPAPERLTRGQGRALAAVARAFARGDGSVVLVDGVTGSGKTEVYLEAIEAGLALGKGAIVLVPEISLTPQTVGRFRSRFPGKVAVLHSRLTPAERRQQWELIREGSAQVVVGARSALFSPLPDLGLVVIDEEHEFTYKQEQAPRYHARDVAARLVAQRGATLVLGSATPSLESLERCRAGRWRGAPWERVAMPERPGAGALPEGRIVDLRGRRTQGGMVFTPELASALKEAFERGEKSIVLLNRRGFATFLMCQDCGCVPECPHCSSSLTYHARSRELMCHSCGRIWPVEAYPSPTARCPHCGSRYLQAMGVGTERVEAELASLLSDAPIIRMDADTTRGEGGHQRILERFDATPAAVLVGTQMIAKGLDFPEVTLVGVVNADTSLKLPDFRAAERTYDLLEQVAGRAGRGERPGRVIIQSHWATHPAIASIASHDRDAFVATELEEREEALYPPFARLANVICTGRDERRAMAVMGEVANRLRARAAGKGWQVVGPSACLRSRVKDRFRHHVIVKAPTEASLGPALLEATHGLGGADVSIAIDIDPYDLL